MRRCALALLASLAACDGAVGTIAIEVVGPPGVDPLAVASRVRLSVDDPPTVVEAGRGADGRFALALDVIAEGQFARVSLEALDDAGALVGVGLTPRLPLGPIDARVTVYVGPPDALAEAPVRLPRPLSELATAGLGFGALWAGGLDASGDPADDLTIYNVYDHALQRGEPLPAPRAGLTAAAGASSFVYLFGGIDPAGAIDATLWRFDTAFPPAGRFLELGSDPSLARARARAARIGSERVLVTGSPGAVIDGVRGDVRALGGPPLTGAVATLALDASGVRALVVGDGSGSAGAVLLRDGALVDLTEAPAALRRTGHAIVVLPSGDALVVGGGDSAQLMASAVVYRQDADRFELVDDLLATPRRDAATAVVAGRVLIAGGLDAAGAVLADAELFDADTLAPLGVVPLVVGRAGASAAALDNGQIVIAGGLDASGAPTDVLELYTPARWTWP